MHLKFLSEASNICMCHYIYQSAINENITPLMLHNRELKHAYNIKVKLYKIKHVIYTI